MFNLPNLITLIRIFCAPLMWWLIWTGDRTFFAWVLTFAFFTDLIDGRIARKMHAETRIGSILDSYGDTLTILSGLIGLFVFNPELFNEHMLIFAIVIGLHVVQLCLSLWRYRKPSSFHTWSAKIGAIVIGSFLIITLHFHFIPTLFYLTMFSLAVDAIEESVLVFLLPEWKNDVKGIWWVMRSRRESRNSG